VADEAIERRDSTIITYRMLNEIPRASLYAYIYITNDNIDPIIFRGLKSLTFANTQQTTLLRLAQEGISVYSPHTAVDAAPGGLNDFLADIVTGEFYKDTSL